MNPNNKQFSAIGKRKEAVAKVFLKYGSGNISVNAKNFHDFFSGLSNECDKIQTPFLITNTENKYDVVASVKGGGINSQLDALCLAIAKSICKIDNNFRALLNKSLILRRDSRIKERRKYGLKKARKASQYSKR